MSAYERHARLVGISDQLVTRIDRAVCDACEGECWTIEIIVNGIMGGAERQWIAYRDHVQSWGSAIRQLGHILGRLNYHIIEADVQRYQLEHQLQLDLG